jgi:hypothetical protein
MAWDDMIMSKFLGGMSFRDIELFNLVLLAKQTWRILQEPVSLSARTSKMVYFPQGDFWRPILALPPLKSGDQFWMVGKCFSSA